jgi:N-acetylated-alpha-linked acidic dipeptidase
MLRLSRPVLLPLAFLLTIIPSKGDDRPLRGFSVQASRVQVEWETKFRALPSRDSLRSYMQHLSARPHHLGSPYDKANAEWLRDRLAGWGWDAKLETFDVLFPTPLERVVELVGPTRYRAQLNEPEVPGDPSSSQQAEQLPTYNAYSIDGDVTAPLIYVNYGIPADYDSLARRGISVKGAIVIARYGASWRGIKPKLAAEHGAVGCIIYSDPRDDGYHGGDVYPSGPWRSRSGVQRGSVMDMPLRPGDPLTPGIGAIEGAPRIPMSEAATLTRIPVLPISYGDAEPLLAAISGTVAPRSWQGGLPITYHIGPSPARVHLKARFDWKTVRVYDVIARLPGATQPDQWIIRGNHHDAWVNGAEDPISGQVSLLEEARSLGELYRQGWRPARTIIYAAWGGEEQGLLGSTEWAEAHAEELSKKAVAYLNTDSNGRGYLDMGGSHSLERFMNEVARDITDPETGLSVWKRLQLRIIQNGSAEDRKEARTRGDLRLDALGSGSDFTPFLQHLRIASLNLGFGGSDGGGIYHSIYDDFRWFTTFSDTSFAYGQALSQTVGTAVMRLAAAQLLPFEFTRQADTYNRYLTELKKLAAGKQEEVTELRLQLEEGVFAATNDPRSPGAPPPPPDEDPPHLNFAPLENALAELTRAAAAYDRALNKIESDSGALDRRDLRLVNRMMLESERTLGQPSGLPGRSWFSHLIYAPGFYTGYGVKTMPGIREAIEQGHWTDADREIERVAASISLTAAQVASSAEELAGE